MKAYDFKSIVSLSLIFDNSLSNFDSILIEKIENDIVRVTAINGFVMVRHYFSNDVFFDSILKDNQSKQLRFLKKIKILKKYYDYNVVVEPRYIELIGKDEKVSIPYEILENNYPNVENAINSIIKTKKQDNIYIRPYLIELVYRALRLDESPELGIDFNFHELGAWGIIKREPKNSEIIIMGMRRQ